MMLTAPIEATGHALRRSGLTLDDIDLIEINEAFASVVLAWQRETGADLAKVNASGGAIALGHPLGATGARLLTTLLYAPGAHRRPARPADHVRRRRPGQRHDHRTSRLTSTTGPHSPALPVASSTTMSRWPTCLAYSCSM